MDVDAKVLAASMGVQVMMNIQPGSFISNGLLTTR
jgi:hypothetical protein